MQVLFNRAKLVLAMVVFSIFSTLAFTGAFAQSEVRKQYIVVTDGTVTESALTSRKAKIKNKFRKVLKGYTIEATQKEADLIYNVKGVRYVEEDIQVKVSNSPTTLWGLDRLDQSGLPLDGVFKPQFQGQGVDVFVVDTGINITHEEFGGRASVAVDTAGDGRNGIDCHGHGTHVAGTVAGSSTGVAKAANVRAVRVFNCNGTGSVSSIIAGLDWIAVNKTRPSVANISLIVSTVSFSLNTAIENLISNDVTVVAAAGNYNMDACNFSPSSVPRAIVVAASGSLDGKSSYSNWGACVDIFAPGDSIESLSHLDNTSHRWMSGTSMSAPHVAGIAAAYLEDNPYATSEEVHDAIKYTAALNIIGGVDTSTQNRLAQSWSNQTCGFRALVGNGVDGLTQIYMVRANSNGVITGRIESTSVEAQLMLEKYRSGKWSLVATGKSVTYEARKGDYRWLVSASGDYAACLQ